VRCGAVRCGAVRCGACVAGPKLASAALNRQRQRSKIDAENDRMHRRLQAVRPTMPRAAFEKHAEAQKAYCALRMTSVPPGGAAGGDVGGRSSLKSRGGAGPATGTSLPPVGM
jgi:hypothetical protein